MQKSLATLLVAIALALLFLAMFIGIKRTERNECRTWKTQALEYKGFYLNQWQKAQCKYLNQ